MALRFLNSGYFAGKVGIGTDSPDAQLDIGVNNIITLDDTGSSTGFIGLGSYNNGTINRAQGQSYYGFGLEIDRPNQLISFKSYDSTGATNSGVGILTLKRDGNVGIGTNSPGSLLEIKKGVQGGLTLPLTINPGFYQAGTSSGIGFLTDGNTSYTKGALVYTTNGTGWNIGDFQFLLRNDGNTNLVTLADAKMTIKASGKVGIGTSTPSANLYVSGSNADATDKPTMMSESVFTIKPVALNSGNLNFAQVDSGNSIGMQYTNGAGTANWDISMQPFGGNVGIGTTSPDAKLVVSDGTQAFSVNPHSTGIDLHSTGNLAPHYQTDFTLYTGAIGSGSARVTVDSSGNVGINTTSPDFKLDVDGTFGVSDLPFNTDSVSVLVANETLGADIVTNGNFTTDTDWSLNTGVTISGGTMNFTSVAGQYGSQNVGFTNGAEYILTFEITAETSGTLTVFLGAGNNIGGVSGVGKKQIFATADSTLDTKLYFGNNFTGSIDNVVLKQVTSASDQIQKRELGTGAFGPTPVGAYLPLAGGTMTGTNGVVLPDNFNLKIGTGSDLQIYHSGTESKINNDVGNLSITNFADDSDIIFSSDNGFGGVTEYFRLDGGAGYSVASKDIRFDDNVKAKFGISNDLQIYHDGSNSYIKDNGIGDLRFMASNIKFYDNGTAELMAQMIPNGAVELYYNNSKKFETTSSGIAVTGDIQIDSALLSNQENTDVDTGAEVVAQVAYATYTAAFFDFVVKKGTNVRSGTVYACHNGDTTPLVEFTETSTNDLGDTSDVTLSVDISGTNMRLLATVTSDDWSVKSLIRAI